LTTPADVIVIGAGLAGLASSVLLARLGFSVRLIEQDSLPKHRVCGEYVSQEALPFLARIGLHPETLDATWIDRFELTTRGGRHFQTPLRLGGFGISRYQFDFALLKLAHDAGVIVEQNCMVKSASIGSKTHLLHTSQGARTARLVLGCFGKRSELDYALNRQNAKVRTPYIAVKRHFRGAFPKNVVSLHTIPGGYCGVSAVEGDLVNVCYLTTVTAIKRGGGLRTFDSAMLRTNVQLSDRLKGLTSVFEKPLVISQINFGSKAVADSGILMLGDAAGLLHPLAGNGMAMALRSAALAVPEVTAYLRGESDRSSMIANYDKAWQNATHARRRINRVLQRAFESDKLSEALCRLACAFPDLARTVIENTHGRPF
jgi:menaquinone-9 beta-reductase